MWMVEVVGEVVVLNIPRVVENVTVTNHGSILEKLSGDPLLCAARTTRRAHAETMCVN